MKKVLITIMLAAVLTGIPVFATTRNDAKRTAGRSAVATYAPEPALPQRYYYRRRHRRHRYIIVRRHYRRRHYRYVIRHRRRRY